MSELDILILGPVPPPFGGIGVHVDRLVPLLQNEGLRVGVLNHFGAVEKPFVLGALKRNPLNYFRLPKKFPAHVVHYHHSHWWAFMAVALGKRRNRSRYIVTLHGAALANRLNSGSPLIRLVTRWALRRFDVIIVVNPHISTAIQDRVGREHIHVVPAFPGTPEEEPPYEASIEAFLTSGRTLLVPVYRIQFLRDGRELYGLDTVVDAFAAIAEKHPELRLAFFIANRPTGRKASAYLSSLTRRLDQAGLKHRVLIVIGLSLMPALRHDVILVRATRSEGDALSIREAIGANVPVVASNVVNRPPGAMTFRVDDFNDLSRALDVTLARPRIAHERVGSPVAQRTDDEVERLLEIYRSQLCAMQAIRRPV
jgi:glycosyltransferase involved in cell wall biosynthesis